MRVIVYLTLDGIKETRLEGDSQVFDNYVDYQKGYDKRLGKIGFWIDNWRYLRHGGHGGRPHQKSRIFIPWSSALFIQEVKE